MCVTAAGRDPSATSLSHSASTLFAAATAPALTATVCAPSATKGRAVERVRESRVNGVMILEAEAWFHSYQLGGGGFVVGVAVFSPCLRSSKIHLTHPLMHNHSF